MKKLNLRFCVGGLILTAAAILSLLSILVYPAFRLIRESTLPNWGNIVRTIVGGIPLYLRYVAACDLPLLMVGIVLMLKPRRELTAGVTVAAAVIATLMSLVIGLLSTGTTIKDLYFMSYLPYQYRFRNLLIPVPYLVLFALNCAGMFPKLDGLRKLWMLAGVVAAVHLLVGVITEFVSVYGVETLIMKPYLDYWGMIPAVLLSILGIVGIFLAGHWIAYPERKVKTAVPPQPAQQPRYQPPVRPPVQQQYQPQPPRPRYQQPQQPVTQHVPAQQGGSLADELSKYRALLDNGTITQEEFDIMKKRLLNM